MPLRVSLRSLYFRNWVKPSVRAEKKNVSVLEPALWERKHGVRSCGGS
ncbi:hypothetical protein MPNT_10007 [Candidatus Methylacidithermus pantelleriae]|uniref:Uncharacterized protein n=1 Tax=Candidatus Methylacidithermus pantelleriae TaxID=2744239 RepID=A0A8J2BLB5_9BACT|nr:hypothetical protein MPNT_10007 [Candidatus Methylacidithermus pantelleriae]